MPSDTKTRERTEGAAAAVQAKHGDTCFANRVDPDPMCLTSFGDDSTGLPALPCSKNDALVGNGAAAPKSCISPLEIRTTTAAGGLLSTGATSTATRITFDQPPLWFCPTEEIKLRASIQYASYYSIFWRTNNQQAPFWPWEQNRGKVWCSIPAGLQVVSTPAHFWERGARCFVGRFL